MPIPTAYDGVPAGTFVRYSDMANPGSTYVVISGPGEYGTYQLRALPGGEQHSSDLRQHGWTELSADTVIAPSTPTVEVIGYRDPDGPTTLVVFLDGKVYEAAATYVVDPGADGDRVARESARGERDSGTWSDAAADHLIDLTEADWPAAFAACCTMYEEWCEPAAPLADRTALHIDLSCGSDADARYVRDIVENVFREPHVYLTGTVWSEEVA